MVGSRIKTLSRPLCVFVPGILTLDRKMDWASQIAQISKEQWLTLINDLTFMSQIVGQYVLVSPGA